MTEFNEQAASRICSHMNDDHAISVYGMVLANRSSPNEKGEVKDTKMTSITMNECTLSYVLCNKESSDLKTTAVKFDPPPQTVPEVRRRLIEIHHKVLAPNPYWLVTDPLSLAIIIISICLAYGTYAFGGKEGLSTAITNVQLVQNLITTIFGSADTFAT
eukprot:CAMPEP_0194191914 /NCGR_PEP_ID=MMETSP0154-20130528/68653_1 /TAXON_ID=1049557 /ORGANISM="Thalassiothrix antarctica, Strain L6-D1" /LENGTH=159 /DNA_ID=CAMNT_0038914961 /DNA_START=22 /DNA_END=497 /DNA_ORIENTATION=+